VVNLVDNQIMNGIYNMVNQFVAFIPILVAIIILIIVGKIFGTFLGKLGARALDRIGLDDLVDRTVIGGMIRRGRMSTVAFFDVVIRWLVYIIFASIILNLLNIQAVNNFINLIIYYIPLVISALIVLIIGFLIVDFIGDLVKNLLISVGIDEKFERTTFGASLRTSGLTASGIVAGLIRLFGYLMFLTTASNILQLTMITQLLIDITLYLPRLFTGILILMIGILSIDLVMDYLAGTVRSMNIEGTDIMIPLLRGFLFLIVILVALDTMLVNTSILYLFFGPLAWGIAIIVAFKYGVKDAIVAYAKERK
jgi:Conserved TM helix